MLMKNNFLSLMGMRLKGCSMNDPEITRKSRGNHAVITRFGKVITMILFLFTFAIGQMWGAAHSVTPNISGTQYEIYNIYSNSSAYAFFSSKTAIRSAYDSWVSGELSNKSDGGATALEGWLATSSGKPGYGKGQVSDTKVVTMTITNCIEVAYYSKSGGSSRTSNLSVKYNDEEVGEVATNGNTYAAVVYGTALDASKTYTITLSGSNSSNCEVDQIRFKAPAGSVCTASLGGTTSNASATVGESAGTTTCTVNNGSAASATSYQWYKTTSDKAAASSIEGETSSSYSPNEASAGTYYYYCKVTTTQITTAGAAGTVETDLSGAFVFAEASCSAPTDPEITGTTAYTEGDNISLTASATGATSATFTWYKGADWATASAGSSVGTGATLSINSCATSDAGTYWCNISNGAGCEIQVSKTITVSESALLEVDAPTELSSTEQTATSLTFGWTAAEHASSYDVYLYTDEGCSSLATPTESNPQNVTIVSATFTGLTVSTTYYCKVQSKGDGTIYKVNGGITAAASAETPCTAITPTWVYPFTKIAVGITPSNPVDGNLGEGTVTYTSSATAAIDPSNAHWAKAAGSATITADVAAAGNYCSGSVTSGTIEVVADQEGIITQALTTGSNAWNASTPTTTDGTNITNLVALHAVGEGYTISGNGNGNNGGQTAKVPSVNASSCDNTKYLEMSFTVATGKRLNVSAIYIPVQPVTSNFGKFKAVLSDGTTDVEGTVSNIPNGKLDYIRFASFGTVQGDVTLRIYAWNWNAGYRMGRNVIIAGEIETIPVSSYDITYTEPSDGSYTIQVGEAAAVSANTTANNGETITLAATPASGYRLKAWDVYKTGESTTKVSVSNNTFTMPAYAVTVSATFEVIPTVNDLVTIADDYTFTPSATIAALTLAEDNKFLAVGDGCTYGSNGLLVKENRALAFKVNNGAKVKVTFTEKDDSGTPREMQLGTAASDDDNKAYGHSGESPATFTVTADGVVYLTASKDLSFSQLEIMYPHTVTYDLNSGDGTLPTESAHYVGDKFNLHDGEDGITAPTDKEFAGWNDGTTTYVGGAEYTMGASAVTLTAQWATPLPEPTITFNNGAYTIGGVALDLSTLFASNSDGAVTYSVKTAGETGAAIDGTSFTATAAGSAVVTASQAATASYKTKSVDATITISAPSEIDGIKLVEDGVLTGNFRTSASLKDQERTIKGITYSKYINLSSRSSWGSQPAGPDNYLLQYTLTKKTNTFYFYAYNKNSGGKSIKVYVKEEGENIVTKTIDIPAGKGDLLSCEVNVTKNAEVLISHTSGDVQICQVVVVESGDALLLAPEVGYNISFNKGRLTAKQNTAKTFEGMTYCNNADYKIDNSSNLKLTTRGTHYVSFEIPTGQTRQLQVTAGGGAYNVSKVLGDDKKATVTGNNNINLGAGIWYINPQGSDVTITNLKFVAAPASMTIAFDSKGGSDVESQLLFVGDKVAEPEAPTKTGYRLDKWQRSGADYDFDYTLVAGDAPGFTLDAVWQKTWKVTFDADNGSDPVVVVVDNNQAVAQPANPEKSGFDFVEWQLSGSAYDFATLVTEDITLKATWEVAQDDATLSALSYNGNAIDVASAEDVSGVQTYTYHLPWGSTVDPALISVTPTASTATKSSITYNNEEKQATFQVTSGNGLVSINYAIQFVIDAKRGTSLIKATTNNVVTGLIGGTIDQSYSGNANSRKLNKGNYFGVTLANDETFQEGDVFIVNITTPADLGKFMIYADKDRTELVADQGIVYTKPDVANPVICPTGEMMMTLPAAANGKKSLYLSRENAENTQQWNVTFSYIEVTREKNPAIKSFKFGDDAATINESAKTISIEVPYATDVTALTPTVEAYGNNGATYTPAGATDFTSPVVYTVTDAYNELHTDYTVTVNIAAPSENAYLASLSVAGYTLDFNKEEVNYNIVLDYGTTVLPTITYEVEEAGLATAVKVENGVNGATTITVTPQAGAGYEKVYTINFSVSTTPKFVIYDGQKSAPMAAIATSGSDVSTGFAWTITGASNTGASNGELSFEGKTYSKYVNLFTSATKAPGAGDTRYITITIPDGYLAKFRVVGCGNGDNSRSSYISKEITGILDQSIAYATTTANNVLDGRSSALQLPGTYYYCADNSIRLYELSVQLYPIDYSRDVTEGRYGTICLPNSGVMVGADIFEIAYMDYQAGHPYKIYFDEVLNGVMEAGMPYVFLPKVGATQLGVFYTDEANATAGHYNGLYGSYTRIQLPMNAGNYILLNNQYYYVDSDNVYCSANRGYIKLAEVPNHDPGQPAYGRRRIALGVQGENSATGVGEVQGDEVQSTKVIIDGHLYILRGEKMYDAKGQLVK